MRQANGFDAPKIADALRRENVPTLLNNLRYQASGDLTNPQIWIYQVVNNEFQQVDWK